MEVSKPVAVILAGGRSSRMGVESKALLDLAGQSLLARVADRLRPQASGLLLSCEGTSADFGAFGLPLLPDLLPRYRGPLVGLYSALQYLHDQTEAQSLVLCPCDAPFVPLDLVAELQAVGQQGWPAAVAWRGVLQPTFSLWHTHHLEVVREAVLQDCLGGPRQVLGRIPHEVLDWPEAEPPPFFNINTPADLASAGQWLDRADR